MRNRRDRIVSIIVFSTLGVWLAANVIALWYHVTRGEWFAVTLEGVAFMAIVSIFVLLVADIRRAKGGRLK